MTQAWTSSSWPTPSVSDSLRFERRRADRHRTAGLVTSLQQVGTMAGRRHHKIASLELLNLSTTGLCVLSGDAVALQTPLTIFFPPHSPEHGFDVTGRVVRCKAMADGRHELGIALDPRPAA